MLTLRKFQLPLVNILDELPSSILVAPTGSGKTMIGCALAWREIQRGGKVCFVIPRDNLARQTERTLKQWDLSSAFILGNESENRSANVQIASYQSLGSQLRDLNWLIDITTRWIIDEAHITAFAKALEKPLRTAKSKIGLTATPWQMQQRSLLDIFDRPVFAPNPGELIKMGFLAKPIYFIPTNKGKGSKLQASPEFVYDHWDRISGGERTFIFCNSINHSDVTARYFQSKGTNAVSVTSKTECKKVEKTFEEFRQGIVTVLVSCQKLAEGCDIPEATTVILNNRTDNRTSYFQRLGRGARIAPGKESFKVIDFVKLVDKFGKLEDVRLSEEDFDVTPKDGDRVPFKVCPIETCNRLNHPMARVCKCGHIFDFELVEREHTQDLIRLTQGDWEDLALEAFHNLMLRDFRQGVDRCEKEFFKMYSYYPPNHWVVDAKLPDNLRSQAVDVSWRMFKKKVMKRLPQDSIQLSIPGLL
jgi:superfamily II DNA or RNA helicase